MKITLIGSGRVATHLALALQNQHQIVQVFSPKLAHAQKLAQQLDAQAISSPAQLDPQVDLVIVTVSIRPFLRSFRQLLDIYHKI